MQGYLLIESQVLETTDKDKVQIQEAVQLIVVFFKKKGRKLNCLTANFNHTEELIFVRDAWVPLKLKSWCMQREC